MRPTEAGEDLKHFGMGQNSGQSLGTLGSQRIDPEVEIQAQDLAIQEQERAERLVLGRSRNLFVHG